MSDGKRYVVGDIHGCAKSFHNLVMEKLRLTKDDTLFLLGDYIDRGPDSKSVLDFIMELQEESYSVKPIMGNHEYMLLKSLDDEAEFVNWKKNGSTQTLLSFGIPEEKLADPASVRLIPELYINFLSGLSFFEETDDYYFVHAGLGRKIENPMDDLETLFWSRKEDYNKTILRGRILIHGHTPVSKVSIQDRIFDGDGKVLNLDGGCVYPHVQGFGHLVGMNLDSFELFFQKNIEQGN
jgi:serine/threonine protein phosphatase 1